MRTLLLITFILTALISNAQLDTVTFGTDKLKIVTSEGRLIFPDGTSIISAASHTPNTYIIAKTNGDFNCFRDAFDALDTMITRTDGVKFIIAPGTYEVDSELVVNYSFPIYIEGSGINNTLVTIGPSMHSGGISQPLFSISTDVHLSGLTFDGSTNPSWKTHNAARFICHQGTNTPYIEVRKVYFKDAYTAICFTKNLDIYMVDFIIENCVNGVGVGKPDKGGSVDLEIGNFVDCNTGIRLHQGDSVDIFLHSLRFINCDTSIHYNPTLFVNYRNISLMASEWDREKVGLHGFDFTLQRDADIQILGNIGFLNKSSFISLDVDTNNAITAATAATWIKVLYDTTRVTSEGQTKFSWINTGRVTYLSDFTIDVTVIYSINLTTSTNNRNGAIALIKNGNTTEPLLARRVRVPTSNQPVAVFSTGLIRGLNKNDYLEFYINGTQSGVNWIVQDASLIIQEKN